MFKLNEEVLTSLCHLNYFPIPDDDMIFFGLRGCLPVNDFDSEFRKQHDIEVVNVDHIHPRCTLGQWTPDKGIALFPGSTVPHQKNVKKALAKGGAGANQLMTGLYKDYRKGIHKAGIPTGHEAFRQSHKLPIRRTGDDLDYDMDDRVEYMHPFDNLHAGWSMGVDHESFASAGCQVVVGYPKCERRNNKPNTGAWKFFQENAYKIPQNSFSYILLPGRYAQTVANTESIKLMYRLRYGSQDKIVAVLQEKLKDKGFYEGNIDEDFGSRTLFALLEYQTTEFGSDADDGIVGPSTAFALDINWIDDN